MAAPTYYLTATDTTVTFHVTHQAGYNGYRLFLRRSDSTDMILAGTPMTQTASFTYTVTGLSPETWYTANVYYKVSATSEDNTIIGAQQIQTEAEATRPSNWAWTTTIAPGAAVPLYGGILAPVTAAEWNAFCARINEFRVYSGLSEWSFTVVTPGTGMVSDILAEAIVAISGIPSSGYLPTTTDLIDSAFWLQLAAAINAIA